MKKIDEAIKISLRIKEERKEKNMEKAGLKLFENKELGLQVRTIVNEDGSISVNAEDTATGFGWYKTELKNGKEYVSIRWATLNGFCKEFGFDNKLAKDDYIPESLFYMLGMKANNEKALKYQKWIAIDVLPSLRKTGTYSIKTKLSNEKQAELEIKKMRAEAMQINAKTRAFKELKETLPKEKLSNVAMEVFGIKFLEDITGKNMGSQLPQVEVTYSATEIGNKFGVSPNKIGRIAKEYNLKTEEYGITVMDKVRHSSKEIPNFRYNEKAVKRFKEILNQRV